MKLFGWQVPGTERRYVECPACGSADYRYTGSLGRSGRYWRRYVNHCRACGAHLEGDKSKDFPAWEQWDMVGMYYVTNALVWAAIWFFALAIPIMGLWEFPARKVALLAALAWGAGWGLVRSRNAHRRGEMLQKKRRDTPIGAVVP